MKTQWILVKYVPDAARFEPQNVGLVLRCGDTILSRFHGETDEGTIDGRSVGGSIRSLENYKAWVRHWKREIGEVSADRFEEFVECTVKPLPTSDSYFASFGGERRWFMDSSDVEPRSVLDELFLDLVDTRKTNQAAKLSTRELVEELFKRIGIAEKIESDVPVISDEMDEVRFDYRYKNGSHHYMKLLNLRQPGVNPWDAIHAAGWAFDKLHETKKNRTPYEAYALVAGGELDGRLSSQQENFIKEIARPIRIDAEDSEQQLKQALRS